VLARVSLAFFFAVVPVGVVVWDYYILVYRDGLSFFFLDDILDEWYF
jgi:hypothetical protein